MAKQTARAWPCARRPREIPRRSGARRTCVQRCNSIADLFRSILALPVLHWQVPAVPPLYPPGVKPIYFGRFWRCLFCTGKCRSCRCCIRPASSRSISVEFGVTFVCRLNDHWRMHGGMRVERCKVRAVKVHCACVRRARTTCIETRQAYVAVPQHCKSMSGQTVKAARFWEV